MTQGALVLILRPLYLIFPKCSKPRSVDLLHFHIGINLAEIVTITSETCSALLGQ